MRRAREVVGDAPQVFLRGSRTDWAAAKADRVGESQDVESRCRSMRSILSPHFILHTDAELRFACLYCYKLHFCLWYSGYGETRLHDAETCRWATKADDLRLTNAGPKYGCLPDIDAVN
jgi:hypothetical protein